MTTSAPPSGPQQLDPPTAAPTLAPHAATPARLWNWLVMPDGEAVRTCLTRSHVIGEDSDDDNDNDDDKGVAQALATVPAGASPTEVRALGHFPRDGRDVDVHECPVARGAPIEATFRCPERQTADHKCARNELAERIFQCLLLGHPGPIMCGPVVFYPADHEEKHLDPRALDELERLTAFAVEAEPDWSPDPDNRSDVEAVLRGHPDPEWSPPAADADADADEDDDDEQPARALAWSPEMATLSRCWWLIGATVCHGREGCWSSVGETHGKLLDYVTFWRTAYELRLDPLMKSRPLFYWQAEFAASVAEYHGRKRKREEAKGEAVRAAQQAADHPAVRGDPHLVRVTYQRHQEVFERDHPVPSMPADMELEPRRLLKFMPYRHVEGRRRDAH